MLLNPNSALDQNDIRWSALDWIKNAKQITPVNKELDWKKCKLLRSSLDTSAHITRRKMRALEHMKTFKTIFDSHKLKIDTKVRTFNTYVATIFLYNSETCRVANSHSYGVILTHLTCYSRTHAFDKFTHSFKINHTHTDAIL